jgi:AcrR family transcriptional regulator
MSQQHSGGGDISWSLALMWGHDDPSVRRGPKPRLTLDAIVDRAIAIADAEGLDAVSMRRVAADLGVGTMSLYRYVPAKEELLDLMLERVTVIDEDAGLGDEWRPAMASMGHRLWEHYTVHPWLPLVDQTRPLLGPNAVHSFEVALAALASTGLSGQEKVGVISAVDAVVQSAARTFNAAESAERTTGVGHEEFWKAQEPLLSAAMESGRYPHMASLDEDAFDMDGHDYFEFCLERLLDGIEVLVDRRPSPKS